MLKEAISIHISLHYSESHKEGFSIFREDRFIFGYHDDDKKAAAFKYIEKKMKALSDFQLYVQKIVDTKEKDLKGLPILETFNDNNPQNRRFLKIILYKQCTM